MNGRLRILLLFPTLALAALHTLAQTAEPADPAAAEVADEIAVDEGAADAASDEGSADEESPATSEVFIPTEEISEDFAVSFPVDI